jgi:surface polysaccharide O-acyltransferase-like enzyme
MHSALPGGTRGNIILTPFYYVTTAGFILFFMVSGALVFYEPKPFVPFIKRRLAKIILPMVIWTVITLLFDCFTHRIEWSQLPNALMLIPFEPQFGTYWFIYVLFGIYLLAPMVASWLEKCSRRDVGILLIVSMVAMSVPYLRIIDKDFSKALYTETGSLYYFAGYLWICMMGYYIRRYVNIPKFKWWHVAIFLGILALPVLLRLMGEPYVLIQKNTSVNIVLLTACFFIIIKHIKLNDWMKRIVYNLSQYTFGIYLVHKQIDNFVLTPLFSNLDLHYSVSIPLVFILDLAISYTVVYLISKLPFSRFLIGI